MEHRKKWIGKGLCVLALAAVLCVVPSVKTQAAIVNGDWEYEILDKDAKTAKLTKYRGNGTDLELPSELDGYSIIQLREWLFYNSEIKSVKIPECVTTIKECVFSNCYELSQIEIPSKVTYIGEYVFDRCLKLTEIKIPNGVTTIKEGTFRDCKVLKSIELPNGLTTIEDDAFENCYVLVDIKIPSNVTEIGIGAFAGCNSLTAITIPEGVTEIKHSTFADCKSLKSISIPDSVKSIGSSTFAGCSSLISVTLPCNLKTISSHLFAGSGVISVEIPLSVEKIYYSAFNNCSKLQKIYYMGSRADWIAMDIETSYNDALFNAEIIYHTHKDVTTTAGTPATCTTDGTKTYYTCPYCRRHFEDADCTKPITEDIDTWKVIPASGHKSTDIACVPATTDGDGTTAGKKCSVCGELLSGCDTIPKIATVKLEKTAFVCDGKAKNPKLIVKDSKGNAIAWYCYDVTQTSNRKDVGTYPVTVTFKGNYKGTVKLSFVINPKGTSISKVIAGKNSLEILVKKQAKQTTGYEIQAATDKNFKKDLKKTTIKSNKTSATLKKLKGGKKYYVRVRTYKTAGGKKYYSDWKKYSKTVTTKK